MSKQIKKKDLETCNRDTFKETINPGDKFKDCFYIYEVKRLYTACNNPEYDIFECQFWDSHSSYDLGEECNWTDTYYRCQINNFERL